MKFKFATIRKVYENKAYVFKRGIAVIPGMWHKNGIPYTITLKEFKQLTGL